MAFIIVADDDPIFSGILRMTLEDDGHVVGSLSDGRSAVEALKLKRPDLAILDVNMPGCSVCPKPFWSIRCDCVRSPSICSAMRPSSPTRDLSASRLAAASRRARRTG